MNVPAAGLLVFDGDCGFCTTSARWIERRLPDDVDVEPWQSLDIEALGLSQHDVTTAAWWVSGDGSLHRGHLAIAESLAASSGAWHFVGVAMRVPPLRWIGKPVYALVAKYRYRLPGSTDACRITS